MPCAGRAEGAELVLSIAIFLIVLAGLGGFLVGRRGRALGAIDEELEVKVYLSDDRPMGAGAQRALQNVA